MANSSGGNEEGTQSLAVSPQNETGDTGVIDALLKLAHEEDIRRFSSVPAPDYDFWARKTAWTVDQAIALSLAKDPTVISWDVICRHFPDIVLAPCQITDFAKFSGFASHFRLRRELLFDNIIFGKTGFVHDQLGCITPVQFVGWIRKHDLWAPDEFSEFVQKHHIDLIDWEQEAFRLKQENERLQFELEKAKCWADEPHPKSRATFQKMILAMARSQYRWGDDCSAVGKIVKAVEKLGEGITISDDAVRSALKDASEALEVRIEKGS
jgi:hypothetical protein